MKPASAPHVPGNSESERMSNALRSVLTVSKADLLAAEEKWKKEQQKAKRQKKAH